MGPFDIAFWQVAPPGEPTKYATIGYLSEHGRLVVNECNTIAQRPTAITLITPTGTRDVPGLPFPVPQGLEIDFTGKNGEKYNFKYDTAGEQASTLPIGSYINGLGTVTGGCVGGKQYTGNAEVQYFVTPGSESFYVFCQSPTSLTVCRHPFLDGRDVLKWSVCRIKQDFRGGFRPGTFGKALASDFNRNGDRWQQLRCMLILAKLAA